MSYIYLGMSVLAVRDDELDVGNDNDELARSRVDRRLPKMTRARSVGDVTQTSQSPPAIQGIS